MTSTHTCNDKPTGPETTPSNCIYPSLNHCDEPVSSILHNLTTKTWSKAAERSLMDHNVKTIGDLSKLTAVKASALRSLRPPSNLVAIKEGTSCTWLRSDECKHRILEEDKGSREGLADCFECFWLDMAGIICGITISGRPDQKCRCSFQSTFRQS